MGKYSMMMSDRSGSKLIERGRKVVWILLSSLTW
jgi:hypothetical protein